MTDDDRTFDTGVSNERLDELTARLREQFASRRKFLSDSAKVGGGALALSLGGAGVAAADDDHGDDPTPTGDGQGGAGQDVSAVDILNFALTLERLEADFYERGLNQYSPSDFEEAEFASACMNEVDETIHARLIAVRDHEQAHVDVITSTINDLGGEPVSGLEFEFPHETPSEFVELGSVLENTGVAAYAGAAPLIEDPELVSAAVSIHSVEARHAAYLNDLTATSPFPRAFDQPKSMDEVEQMVSDFIVSNGGGMGTETQDGGSSGGGSGNGGH